MRIIAGKYKGTTLFITNDKGTRPLKDMVRESIFNLLTHSNKVSFILKKANVLDLYSGTGSFGLECLSREAQKVYFVENYDQSIEILNKNIKKLKCQNKAKVLNENAFNFFKNKELKNLKAANTNESDLFKAMKLVANSNKGPQKQISSMGCSIKWFK